MRLQLEERSPLRVLERGYAICYDAAGNVVQAADQVAIGDEIRVQLARGRLGAEVRERELTAAENLQNTGEITGSEPAAENLRKK